MNVVITGGLGFIGAHLAAAMSNLGFKVDVVDSISDYYSRDLKLTRRAVLLAEIPEHQVHIFNLLDREEFRRLLKLKKPDIVIHLAAQAGVRLPIKDTYKYTEANLTSFSNVLQTVIECEVPEFLFASSSSVYGNSTLVPYSETTTGLEPISFYGATKLSNEILAKSLTLGTKTKSRGLRFFTVYGPWGRPDMAYFRLAANALANIEFSKYGDGSVRRDFTFIADTVEGVVRLAKQLKQEKEGFFDVVNLGGGQPRSLNDLILRFEEVSGCRIQVNQEGTAPGDVQITAADSRYLKSLIDFQPMVELSTGVDIFYDWASRYKTSLKKWVEDVT
jgi:UDP-glucuronate 4-epimerase